MGREIQLWILQRGLDGALAPTQCLCEEDPSVRKEVSAGAWARVPTEGGDAAGFWGEQAAQGALCWAPGAGIPQRCPTDFILTRAFLLPL